MKYFFILFLSFAAVFSTYINPPFSEVESNNLGKSSSLFGAYLSQNKTNLLVFNTSLAWIDSRIIGINPSVDSHISANSNNNLLWVYGETHSNSLSPLDYDNDGCDESATFNNLTIQKQISLDFRNNTISQNDPSNPFVIPSSLQLNQTEYDTLNIALTITALYNYTILDKNPTKIGGNNSGTFCDGEPQKQTFVAISKYSANYTVEGGSVSFFLKTPVLKEQWYKNNRFDNLVFTKRSLYNAKIYLNGKPIAYVPIYEFNISQDEFGFQQVSAISNLSFYNMTYSELNQTFSPKPLRANNESFSLLYEFNASYQGTGVNFLELEFKDHFGNIFKDGTNLTSRFLSSAESETQSVDPYLIREKAKFNEGSLSIQIIGTSSILVLLILLLFRFIRPNS